MTLVGNVLFPWWSSLKPYILSKVMQLRLLLRRKYSFLPSMLPHPPHTCHCSSSSCSFLSHFQAQTCTWMLEDYSLQEQLFSTLFIWTPLILVGEKTSRAGSALSLNSKSCASVQNISYIWYIFLMEIKTPPQGMVSLIMSSKKVN